MLHDFSFFKARIVLYNHFDLRHAVAFLKSGKPYQLLSALQLYILAARCQSSFENCCVSEQQEQTTKALDKYKEKQAFKCISVHIYMCQSTIRQGVQNCKDKQLPEMSGMSLLMFWRKV